MSKKICPACKKEFIKPSNYSCKQWEKRVHCSKTCASRATMTESFNHWKGGRYKSSGYWRIYKPEHPGAKDQYVNRARLVMEKKIGRCLKQNEVVHHINEIKDDDRIENLKLLIKKEHDRLHAFKNGLGKDKKDYRERNSLGQFI